MSTPSAASPAGTTIEVNRGSYTQDDPLIQHAVQAFDQAFSKADSLYAGLAPGRVNLIGEHTDYNDGYVMPFAINYYTAVVGAASKEPKWQLVACSLDDNGSHSNKQVETFTDETMWEIPDPNKPTPWHAYLRGACAQYKKAGVQVPYFNAVIVGNVPLGSGLSSSAALEVGTCMLLEAMLHGDDTKSATDGITIAKRCQASEHEYVHVPCGIMDQFISALGLKDHTMLLDCRTFTYKLTPFKSDNVSLLVINSNVKHSHSGGEYAKRKAQCDAAVKALQQIDSNAKALRDVNLQLLEQAKGLMTEVSYIRARHVVTEDQRTLQAAEALQKNDFATVGKMMTQSHISMKNDYEISCDEIDTLVDLALSQEGVYGSRMTGGGFGGCTVTLVDSSKAEQVSQRILEQYKQQTGKTGIPYTTRPAAGATYIKLR